MTNSKVETKLNDYCKSFNECESRSTQALIQLSSNCGKLLKTKEELEDKIVNLEQMNAKIQKKVEALDRFIGRESTESAK